MIIEPRHEKTRLKYAKIKAQISNCAADQRLCFRHIDCTIPVNFKPLAIFCGCTARFVSDLVGNSEDRFSHDVALCYCVATA